MNQPEKARRNFLRVATAASAGFVFGTHTALSVAGTTPPDPVPEDKEEEVAPGEDLMREHGVLNRVLLIYGEIARRLQGRGDLDPALLEKSVGIIRRFIEDYHEKLEENHLFPRFEKAGKLTDLVKILRRQHQAGRELTEALRNATPQGLLKTLDGRGKVAGLLHDFIRMYRPHEAREDTVLFPAFHSLVSPHEYAALGEQFEDEEHRRFGQDGFEKVVDEVASLEKELGIYDLGQFTPHLPPSK